MSHYLTDTKQILSNQLDFKTGDFNKTQFLSTSYEIYQSFCTYFQVPCVFFNIFGASDKFQYGGLIFNLNQYRIFGNPLQLSKKVSLMIKFHLELMSLHVFSRIYFWFKLFLKNDVS